MRWGLGIVAGGLGAAAALAIAAGALAKPDEPKPPPKPKLELLTASQQEALATRSIKVAVSSKRGRQVRGEATLVVDGFPDDLHVQARPGVQAAEARYQAKLRFPLSARKREVLEFAAQACDTGDGWRSRPAPRDRPARSSATLPPEGC